jgi:dipeptidyl aminopeptidase/acylaminoacyl peptidase
MLLAFLALCAHAQPAPAFDFEHLAALASVSEVDVSPDGERLIWLLSVPSRPGIDKDGPPTSALYLAPSTAPHAGRMFVSHEHKPRLPSFTPDGRYVTFLSGRGHDKGAALWAVPVDGGEARELLYRAEGISAYAISPDGARVAVVSTSPLPPERTAVRDKGYTEEVYEEDALPSRIWVLETPPLEPAAASPGAPKTPPAGPDPLALEGSVHALAWTADGASLLVASASTPHIDDQMMALRVQRVDPTSAAIDFTAPLVGKVGAWASSPDGAWLGVIASADPHDPSPGRLTAVPFGGGPARDLLPGLLGHVEEFAWQDPDTLLYLASVGVERELGRVDLDGTREVLYRSDGTEERPLLGDLAVSPDGARIALLGETPYHPRELYTWDGAAPVRATRSNPWLESLPLAEQRVVRWKARDGLELEGILLVPPGAGPHPLLLMVHGGPEAHDPNGWLSYYARPGQLAAARGFAVFYPNYRGSTGRGVAFSKLSQGDPAGREFDDLLDAVKHLVKIGVADEDRVGITGGSYGGFATAWASTRFSEHFRAGVMFVGISNVMSKGLTTDAPGENLAVHALVEPWKELRWKLTRSPISYVEQAQTPLLIAGGVDDTRVHPAQSLQLYRALEMIGKVPVRYVRYPGEGHGNRRAASRDDYARRLMQWMEHFVRDGGTGLPPRDPVPPVEDKEEPQMP